MAPHKPILLLAVIELIGEGYYSENRITPDEKLVKKFEDVWHRFIADSSPYSCTLSMPFYHLRGESFWSLVPSEEYEEHSEYSLYQLRKSFKYATLDNDLFGLLTMQMCRDKLSETIIDLYFGNATVVRREGPIQRSETQKKNGFFDTLLQKRGLEKCPLPLWRLKVTDDEYRELHDILEKCTHSIARFAFVEVRREAALFFAEYWRREYVEGMHSKQMVYDALGSANKDDNLVEYFYDNACAGARMLRIEQYSGGRTDSLNSMLYQGGLPMKLVTKNESSSVWDRFTRGLVNRRVNFDDLNLGLVATTSTSMRDYCNQLIEALERDQYMLMPFYCQNENDSWFLFLKELSKQEKIRHRQLHPFTLDWEFRVDEVEYKIFIKYVVKGLQKLPALFLDEHRLNQIPFFSAQVRVDGKVGDTFDYANNFCRYTVVSKHPYVVGQEISLYLHTEESSLMSDNIDFSVPYLLYLNKDGKYEMGNQIGKQKSLLLIPEGWEIVDNENYSLDNYTIEDKPIKGLVIDENFSGNVVVKSEDGTVSFGENAKLYWTEMSSNPLYEPDILDSVFDVQQCRFSLCSDSGDGERDVRPTDVQYRDKWQNFWKPEASYGEIFARVKDSAGHFVTPVKFINVGDGLKVSLLAADKDTCQIKVTWPHGHVSTSQGVRKNNDIWEVNKADCTDPRKIQFSFVPDDNSRNQFNLSIRAPFKDFSILDISGNAIGQNALIPYTDVDKYQYHLVGQDIRYYTFGNISRELRWYDDKLWVVELGRKIKQIPYEGSLLALFDSREVLRSMLEKTSKSILEASVDVAFVTSDGRRIEFSIKDAPFRVRQLDDGRIEIFGTNYEVIDFRGALKLFKMDEPDLEPEIITYDPDNGYILPEMIRDWGTTLLTGRTRGRICPAMVNLNEKIDKEYRKQKKQEAITSITEELSHSKIGDTFWKRVIGWFNRVQKEDIPASSILELTCITANSKALVCLAFQMFAQCLCDEDKETLMEQLKMMSSDLAFQWYWLCPYLDGIMNTLMPFIEDIRNPLIQDLYINWAMNQGDRMMELLSGLNDSGVYDKNIGQCLMEKLSEFTEWIEHLCVLSIKEKYGAFETSLTRDISENIVLHREKLVNIVNYDEMFIEDNQDSLEEEVEQFFQQYSEPSQSGNEQWLYRRVNAISAHLKKEIDVFAVSPKIRRSIIYCSKSCHEAFLLALNNKLAK